MRVDLFPALFLPFEYGAESGNLALRAELERFNDSEINVISIGVQYKF